MRASAAILGVAALLVAAPVAGAATALTVEKQCYAEGDEIGLNASGFSPGGRVTLTLERDTPATILERDDRPVARGDGTLVGDYELATETKWFTGAQTRFSMTMRLVDEARRQAGQPADSADVTATTSFIFSRWNVLVRSRGGKVRPRSPATFRAVGYTNTIGEPLYAHWLRGDTVVHRKRLGRLRGPCGDRRVRIRRGFPFRPVAPGAYRVIFTTARTDPASAKDAIVHDTARVRRRIR